MNRADFKKGAVIIMLAVFVFIRVIPEIYVLAEEPGSGSSPETPPQILSEQSPVSEPISPPETDEASDGQGEGDTLVATGESESDLNIENEVNSNSLTSAPEEETASDSEFEIPQPATDSQDFEDLDQPASQSEDVFSVDVFDVENQNNAVIENVASSSAETGENQALSGDGDAIILTGNATAQANVVNVVNTNIVDSNGLFLLFNSFSRLWEGSFDLRNWIDFEPTQCPGDCKAIKNLNAVNQNTASVSNDINVTASTGNNSADSDGGDGIIATGDASAGANVVNVVNTNIVGSNYLLLAFNNFGDWAGDLILPSKNFIEKLIGSDISSSNSQNGNGGGSGTLNNDNEAILENNIQTEAETGDNKAQGADSTTIVTGQANSSSNTLNLVNQNILNSDSFVILLRVSGRWKGDIYNLPSGAKWQEEDGQIKIFSDPEETETADSTDEVTPDSPANSGATNIENTNEAFVKNNVRVLALTGSNQVAALDGNGQIFSGNADAGSNVVNLINTNIFGRNWLFALINIFGDWDGNISFGQPDLFVGGKIKTSTNPVRPETGVDYEFLVMNMGDAPASNVKLVNKFRDGLQTINNISNGGSMSGDDEITWNLGKIDPGQSILLSYNSSVKRDLRVGSHIADSVATITGLEPESNQDNNSEHLSFQILNGILSGTPPDLNQPVQAENKPKLTISKTNDAVGPVLPDQNLKFSIALANEGSASAHEVVVIDKLYNSDNELIHEESWELGEVFAGEEIAMDYEIQLNNKAKPGHYVNSVFASGLDDGGNFIEIARASSGFEFAVSETLPDTQPEPDISEEKETGKDETVQSFIKPAVRGIKTSEEQQAQISAEEPETQDNQKTFFASLLLPSLGLIARIPPAILVFDAILILMIGFLTWKKKNDGEDKNF